MDDLIALLPPEWAAPVTEWVIVALTVALAATAAAHTVLPLARRFEAWAKTTQNTLDDGIASGLLTGLLAISRAGSWLIAHVPRLAVGDPRPPADPTEPKAEDPWAKLPDTRRPKYEPPSEPPIGGALALALVIVAGSLTGCMSSIELGRHALEDTAQIGNQIDRDMAAARIRVSDEIFARPDATRADYDEAMEPFNDSLAATKEVREMYLVAQAALDAAEHAGSEEWRPFMGCVFGGLTKLLGTVTRHVDIPEGVGDVLQVLAGLAEGQCPIPERSNEEGGAQ